MLQLVISLTIVTCHLLSSLTIVIYDCNMFIIEANGSFKVNSRNFFFAIFFWCQVVAGFDGATTFSITTLSILTVIITTLSIINSRGLP